MELIDFGFERRYIAGFWIGRRGQDTPLIATSFDG